VVQGQLTIEDGAFPSTSTGLAGRRKSTRKVLLVEDNPGDARLLRDMLNEEGAGETDLTHVECLGEAEEHLAARAVDVILLDLVLPDAQGLAVVRRARAAAPGVPLVVLTGLDDEALAVQALQEGAQDYLVKGQIETRGLLRALRYAVERKTLEERYRSLMEHANDAILLLQPGLRIIEANRRAEELLGCPRDQIVGRSYESFIAPEDRGSLAADRAALLAEGATRVQDRRLLREDGSVVSVDISASLIRRGDETVLFAILHDASGRNRTEGELRAARKRLHHLVSENPAVIYALGSRGRPSPWRGSARTSSGSLATPSRRPFRPRGGWTASIRKSGRECLRIWPASSSPAA